jgi:thioester reductase-like protein
VIRQAFYKTFAAEIAALRSDLSDQTLGLDDETYQAVTEQLVTVIRDTWSINFNMRLSNFKQTNLTGVLDLIALTRASQNATFNFCSLVSAAARCPLSAVPETVPELE